MAFDEPGRPVLTPEEIGATPPGRLRPGLQPYVTLLVLAYPVDDYVIAVKRREALRAETSNATTATAGAEAPPTKVKRPRPERVHIAVHRVDNRLYYKRLEPAAYRILAALRDGEPLTRAIAAGGRRLQAEQARDWFATWMQLGWFCRRK